MECGELKLDSLALNPGSRIYQLWNFKQAFVLSHLFFKSLCITFFICKMRILIGPISLGILWEFHVSKPLNVRMMPGPSLMLSCYFHYSYRLRNLLGKAKYVDQPTTLVVNFRWWVRCKSSCSVVFLTWFQTSVKSKPLPMRPSMADAIVHVCWPVYFSHWTMMQWKQGEHLSYPCCTPNS